MPNEQRLHPVMLAGTGSDVGKSVLAAAFCRIFRQDGYQPAPFKAQNMALNSYATPEGLEIGRAQAVQAEAAGVACHTDMNPLLLKPQNDMTCQVVLHGKPVGNRSACEFFRREGREQLRYEVCAAFDRLARRYNPVVLEGAGSLAEINLRDVDLVNMPMALHAGADVFLVGDIDRGGVFASVYGSLLLLRPEERRCVKGILINKFRGDIRLFEQGVKMLEELCGIPVLGVIPYLKDVHIDEEDAVVLSDKSLRWEQGRVNVAVVLLRHLSNFTDFNRLERDPRVHLFYTYRPDEVEKADIVLLPGSKCTIDDLEELRRSGVAQAIMSAHQRGATVMGICGGYQMMGQLLLDPLHVEGDVEQMPGLGLLPVVTELQGEKVTRQVQCLFADEIISRDGELKLTVSETSLPQGAFPKMEGYEIHMGTTAPVDSAAAQPLFRLTDGTLEGYRQSTTCMGTYLHGILDNDRFIDYLLKPHQHKVKERVEAFDYRQYKEKQYNLLADHVRQHVNMPLVYQILTNSHD